MMIANREIGIGVRNNPQIASSSGKMRGLAAAVFGAFLAILGVKNAAASGGPVVAIHDSELTRALETMPAANPGTPTGAGTTGFEWWPTNWHYFVMPEALKEALRSDGTAFEVVSDADISAGRLLSNGQPRYPILISLASEAVRDDEISQLTNYVAAGGTLLAGSSAFTRQTNGVARGDFALANAMGLQSASTIYKTGRRIRRSQKPRRIRSLRTSRREH
jgi:hypothetical protein